MRRLCALVVVVALLGAGAALGGQFDPERHITPADQARARAMLVRKADLTARFQRVPGKLTPSSPTCKALDESDLTLTGEVGSDLWATGSMLVFAVGKVYATTADANASWARQTSRAGLACTSGDTVVQFGGEAPGRSVSLARISLPRLAPRTLGLRVVVTSPGTKAVFEVVALQRSRGQAVFVVGASTAAAAEALGLRLARVVAARQVAAMRSA